MNLFDSEHTCIPLHMPGATVNYFPNFFSSEIATHLYTSLHSSIQWQQDKITVYGKIHLQPRLTALYAINKATYSYADITMTPYPFNQELLFIKNKIEEMSKVMFTTCLLNLYRDGHDSNGWHADNEKELGKEPIIASISLGEERWFHFRHKNDKELKKKLLLQHGSLLLMEGKTQENWVHQLPKSKKITKPRINLTFRIINHTKL